LAMPYPHAPRLGLVEDLGGHPVADPFRWLEDQDDPEVRRWLADQVALFADHRERWVGRDHLRTRLEALTPGVVGLPRACGDRLFFPRRLRGEDQAVWVMAEADGSERVVLDPARLSEDGTVVLQWAAPSPEGRHLAYAVDEGGREEAIVRIADVDTGAEVGPPLSLGRGGTLAWLGEGAGLIVVATLPGLTEEETAFHRRVWRLPLGAGLGEAQMIFGEGRDRTTYYGVEVSAEGRWLTVSASLGTAPRNDLYLCDLAAPAWSFVPVIEGVDGQVAGAVAADGRLWLWTNVDAPRGRLVRADPATPGTWEEVVAEGPDVLSDWALTGGAVFVAWQRDVASVVTVHDRDTGGQVGEVALPGLGTVALAARPGGDGDDLWLAYVDELTPAQVLRHRASTVRTEVWAQAPGAPPPPDDLEVVRAFVSSPDGTQVPLFVARRRDQALDGTAPTILSGYGGFQVSLTPAYSAGVRAWVEGGGVFATACLRGGGEYGEAWHRAGMRAAKQNVFDDFLACAGWLTESGHTSPGHLGIAGGSNGGLLVGAALTQAPQLFRAIHCSAPLLDMVRYERFGLGVTWNDEYGSAEVPEELAWLLSYSPYHRVVEATAYPAVLFTTFGGDTRVDPLHARKLCAALQHATACDMDRWPVLLRHEEEVGHGMRTVSRSLDERAEVLSFLAAHLGWPTRDVEPLAES
ncbi:MAG TPA: prolyl oligopeptidase family serine peptidase, partial [Acidimicrobiales bacterium]|nr:prolyl oligopeptidase family serine peptidase [Acidimicrobiales bacterium]